MHCVFVVGAGRSGTSLVASLFQRAADRPVSSYLPRSGNPAGFYEDRRVNAINERILSRYLPISCPLDLAGYAAELPGPGQFWLARLSPEIELQLQPDERAEIRSITGSDGFCIKDPRLSYTLSAWLQCLSGKQLAVLRQICIFRDPAAVVSSVLSECMNAAYLCNYAISVDQILEGWRLQYEWILSKHVGQGEWFFLEYEALFEGRVGSALESFCQQALELDVIDRALNRSKARINVPDSLQGLYRKLQALSLESLQHYATSSVGLVDGRPGAGSGEAAILSLPLSADAALPLPVASHGIGRASQASRKAVHPPVVMTLLCRNEIDIIKAHLDFHFAIGVESVIVTDNDSRDGTYEFLQEYCRHHPIELLHEPELTHDQGRWVTRMAAMAYERFGHCWLVHSDADEFWLPDSGNLPNSLVAVKAGVEAISVCRHNMLPSPLNDPQINIPFYAKLFVEESESLNVLGKSLPGKIVHRAMANVRIGEGNHSLFVNDSPVEACPVNSLKIVHFPVRSLHQLERKIRDGYAALRRNSRLSEDVGRTWRQLGEILECEGSLASYYQTLHPGNEGIRAGLQQGRYRIQDRIFRMLMRQSQI